jgi:hypothetical protein
MSLTFAFDIGYASIGWCVLSAEKKAPADPDILGTGVVTFPTDDCLASTRRDLRRTRRHIRSTRMRIERMKRWLLHRGVLSREDLDRPGHPAPFLLAAAALQGHRVLTAWELWTALRWYAHNRGYDGNSRWARGEEDDEDTEKVLRANDLMQQAPVTETMCETVCKLLKLDPVKHDIRVSSELPYKTLNAAYPRKTVTKEVAQLLWLHRDRIPGIDPLTVRLLMSEGELGRESRAELNAAGLKLPKRYVGGLLFGQLLPRFDNRIIARCPITWARTYDEALGSGTGEKEARRLADKFAKVPSARCSEFLEYRFARVIANIRVGGEPLSSELRLRLWKLATERGSLTAAIVGKEIKSLLGDVPTNLDAYFKLHPDAEKHLILNPAQDTLRKAAAKNSKLAPIWSKLPDETVNYALATWSRCGAVSLALLFEHAGILPLLEKELRSAFYRTSETAKGKNRFIDFDDYLARSKVAPEFPTGRAPYARPVLLKVVSEVLEGNDPTKPARSGTHPDGEVKAVDGVLYETLDPASRIRKLQDERPLDSVTNNHLVRHRLLILDRLLDDITAEFCRNDRDVVRVIVEVGRELKEFSGMDSSAIKSAMGKKLAHFKAAEKLLIEAGISPTANLLKKCRIAMDLKWQCPFTSATYGPHELKDLEFEHIIPRSLRNTDSLSSLVLTRKWVNESKGQRSALKFIRDSAADDRVVSERNYLAWVDGLRVANKDVYPDDHRRQAARKRWLAVEEYSSTEREFTEGQMTQSSFLMKLALREFPRRFPNAICDPIPGPVTAEIRKAWKIYGCLSLACPEIVDRESGEILKKEAVRSLTHLHHALDAATLALAAHYFPFQIDGQDQKGKVWRALAKRRKSEEDWLMLKCLGIVQRKPNGEAFILAPPDDVKQQLARRLAECRVAQHIPSDRSGAKSDRTTWRVVSIEGEGDSARVHLRQRASTVENERRIIKLKPPREERIGKLLGVNPKNGSGKLKAIKGAIVISENYGLALDPVPAVIPFHDVQHRLEDIRVANQGKSFRVLRNGMLVRLRNQGKRDGIWSVYTVQASLKVDLVRPGTYGRPQTGDRVWREVSVQGLLNKGLEILPRRYSGYPLGD